MVQEEKQARFGGMPTSATSTALADYILPAEKMPEKLIEYATCHYNIWNQKAATLKSENSHYLEKIFALLNLKPATTLPITNVLPSIAGLKNV